MKRKYILPILALVLLFGCKKASYLESNEQELLVSINGATDTVKLYSDVNDFKLESAPEWVKTELKDSLLTFSVKANNTKAPRKGEIVIANGDLKLTIPVTQFYMATHLTLATDDEIKIAKNVGSVTIAVDCDGDVSIEGADGIDAKYKNGRLTISAPKNEGFYRTEKITLSSNGFTQDIKVILDGDVCSKCNGKGKIKCPSCDGYGIVYKICVDDAFKACTNCGGKGYLWNNDDGTESPATRGARKGSGKIPCPDCQNTDK